MVQRNNAVSPTRLLVVTTIPGTFHFLRPYVEHFSQLGWQVDALTGDGSVDRALAAALGTVHRVPWSRRPLARGNLTAFRRVRSLLASARYDIVHTHTPIASFVLRLAIATLPSRRRPAVVYTAHGFHFHDRGGKGSNLAYAAAERLASRVTDRLVVINEEDRRAALRLHIATEERLVLLPGIGIDLEHHQRTAALLTQADVFRASLDLPDDAELLSVVAEMIPRKNHAAALEALARNANPVLHLCFAGDGPLRESLEATAHRLGVRDRVHFLGSLPDVRPVLLSSIASVLPSRQEGLSRAVMESLALGVPVIGGRVRGITDLVEPDGGLLIDPDDVDALSTAYDAIRQHDRGDALVRRLQPRLQNLSLAALLVRHEDLYAAVTLRDQR